MIDEAPNVRVPVPLWHAVIRLVEALAYRLETSPTFRLVFPQDAREALKEISDATIDR